ncbi:hypothetical protein CWR43_17245 [Rhizobium sullae]|uniref:DUF1236 domain-containing protein n=1 Tax=Rhizobium sullae TaxID=50338 RepID=A0A2N0D867_RHISU|nr:DUF1236 domain-containing protein [Rhizobium sullae]PKA42298.1 hypothetical protein CWR43_17245 [Rhizobium sullae]
MNRKILPILIASLALGTSPLCLLSASAQDAAPILPKKGAAQGEQPQSGTQQPSGAEAPNAGSGQQAPSGGTGDATTVKPDVGGTGTSDSSSQGTDQPDTQQQDTSKPAEGSSSEKAPASGSESGKSTTKSSGEATSPDGKTTSDKPAGDAGSGNAGTTGGNTSSGTSDQSSKTTGGDTTVNISVEQKTEIQQAVKEVNVEPVRETNFTVAVGTTIPQTVRLEPLPPRIIKIVPQYEGYRFFILADGRIVIVEPSTFEIVYIIA